MNKIDSTILCISISILYLTASQVTSQNVIPETLNLFNDVLGTAESDTGKMLNSVDEVCYPEYGCYNNLPPFGQIPQREIVDLPQSPEEMNLFFTIYKRGLMGGAPIGVGNTKYFDPSLPTTIVSHGYTQSSTVNWMLAIKNNTLKMADHNLILTNWNKGALQVYSQSTVNTRVVGTGIANLVNDLIENAGADISTFHLIGHSLGAHVVGYAGKQIPNLPRITGLDPAGPLFLDTDPIVRLDKTDALFVDIIHTDSAKFGYFLPLGHVDFFPNGGWHQPNCTNDTQKFEKIMKISLDGETNSEYLSTPDILGCSHLYACFIYADTILQGNSACPYSGYACASYQDYRDGNCYSCPQGGCNKMGYSVSSTVQNGSLYLQTLGFPNLDNFCLSNYLVRLKSSKTSNFARGQFELILNTASGQSSIGVLDEEETTFYTSASQTRIAPMPPIGDAAITSVGVAYKRISSDNDFLEDFFYKKAFQKHYNFTDVTLTSPQFETTNYCSSGSEMIGDFYFMSFNPC